MGTMNKILVPTLKPRNPLVAATKFRKAGSHKLGNQRQAAKRDLRKELM